MSVRKGHDTVLQGKVGNGAEEESQGTREAWIERGGGEKDKNEKRKRQQETAKEKTKEAGQTREEKRTGYVTQVTWVSNEREV